MAMEVSDDGRKTFKRKGRKGEDAGGREEAISWRSLRLLPLRPLRLILLSRHSIQICTNFSREVWRDDWND
jgi:hypothetical protein